MDAGRGRALLLESTREFRMTTTRVQTVGERLRQLREENEWQQWRLGVELGLKSPQSGIAKREADEVDTPRAERRLVANLFGLSEAEAFPMCVEDGGG